MYPLKRKDGELIFGDYSANDLIKKFGSPLYVYDEITLRKRCRDVMSICSLPNFKVYYSAKANTAIALLKIIKGEGLNVDAMTTGEIYQEKLAGFTAKEILFLSNNVNKNDFKEVIDQGIKVCIDSLDQLETYCKLCSKQKIYIRINPGEGLGHHEKVITAGKVKFGINPAEISEAIKIAEAYSNQIAGLQIHIGSLFLEKEFYLKVIGELLDLARLYPGIDYIDFGGGLGIPYDRKKESPFPLESFSQTLTSDLNRWMDETGRNPTFAIEPGRFLVAESGACLTEVHSTKVNCGIRFVGTDLGFNFFPRPELYGAYHEIIHATKDSHEQEKVTIVGNVCESGDYLGRDRILPKVRKGDILLVRDTGAYSFSMASNYNSMSRPIELLLQADGRVKLIRKRETHKDLIRNQIY